MFNAKDKDLACTVSMVETPMRLYSIFPNPRFRA